MAKFTPLDEKALEEGSGFELLAPGKYGFEVVKATDEKSKASGDDMIKLRLAIYQGERKHVIFDYLTFSEKSQWKAYGFCKATGLVDKFKKGELSALDCEGKTGEAMIGVQPAKGEFEAKNTIKGYVAVGEEQEIPF